MYQNKKAKRNNITKKILVIILFVATTVAAMSFYLLTINNSSTGQASVTEGATLSPEPVINLDPPTDAESRAGDAQKDEIIDNDVKPDTGALPSQSATVVITDATQYGQEIEVRAFASNVVQSGVCTFTFTKGSLQIKKQSLASADASSTPCQSIAVNRSEFAQAGSWKIEVEYTSDSHIGSKTTNLEIK